MARAEDVIRELAGLGETLAQRISDAPTGVTPGYHAALGGTVLPNGKLRYVKRTPSGIIAICRKTAAQDAIDATPTRVDFNSVTYDPYGTITTGASWVFTVPANGDGYYTFQAQLSLLITGSDWAYDRLAEFEVIAPFVASTLDDHRGIAVTATSTSRLWLRGAQGGPMVAGDTAYIRVTQDSGIDRPINLSPCSLIITKA